MFVCLTELKVAVNVNVILFLLEFNSDYIIQSSWNCSFFIILKIRFQRHQLLVARARSFFSNLSAHTLPPS